MTDTAALLLLPRMRVQNANAVSGPLSWGFPAPTAFTGFVHALERRLRDRFDLAFGGVGIVCHQFEPQVSRPAGSYNQVFHLTRNPVTQQGASAPFVQEAHAHLEVSLLIEVRTDLDDDDQYDLLKTLPEAIHAMRLAGGSILPRYGKRHEPTWFPWYDAATDNTVAFRKLRRRMLPGFALVQRDDLLVQRLAELRQDPTVTHRNALDALLDLTQLHYQPVGPHPQHPDQTLWEIRRRSGWLVPLPIGYAALSPLYPPGTVRNTRDAQTPFRFVESLYSLGQWVSPHRMTELKQLLWQLESDPQAGLYRCINRYSDAIPTAVADIA